MAALPAPLAQWLARRDWRLHPHQQAMLAARDTPAVLLIAPTGGGKTLAGFLPTLEELAETPTPGLHTLYISPLKALAVDIRRNLTAPVAEMGLAVRIEDRTGDTSQHTRRAQRAAPPHILLTTPESLALLLSYPDAPRIFGSLKRVVIDEIHALAESKRGDQLMLGLARLQTLAPGLRRVGLSATVEDSAALARFFAPEGCQVFEADPGPLPDIAMLATEAPPPWAGGGGHYAIPEVLAEVAAHRTTIIFHNTRAQAELFFHALWLANTDNLAIGIHHGSLAREVRERAEAAMAAGELRAVVATGSLDLGLDWGAVDLVIQVGAPKNVKRLVQRIGRANHRAGVPSKALLVPANRFEVIECWAALAAVKARELDGEPRPPGGLDVLCQHLALTACAGPFDAGEIYAETRRAGPYATLSRADFDACLDFCATGGYALRAYDRWRRLMLRDGLWTLRDPRTTRDLRMNIGTIVETETMKVRLRNGAPLGEIEEAFAATLSPGDSFLIGGQVVRYEGMNELTVEVSRSAARRPKIAVFSGSKFSTSTALSARVQAEIEHPDPRLPAHTRDWIALQGEVSALPGRAAMLVESFPFDGLEYACFWGFGGRNAMQTLGMVLTRQMEVAGLAPLGFVASDCAVLIWGLEPLAGAEAMLARDTIDAGLAAWFEQTSVLKRAFREAATVAGLIQRQLPGARKSGRQATFSSDILYDTLARHDPGHLLLRVTRAAALRGMVDAERLGAMVAGFGGQIIVRRLAGLPPLAAPLLLEVGKVAVSGEGRERLMAREAAALMAAAGLA